MTWSNFFLWLILCYVIYYSLTVLYDILFTKGEGNLQNENELFYEEPVAPIDVSSIQKKNIPKQPVPVKNDSADAEFNEDFAQVDSTGGIGISDLFRMKKSEASLITNKFVFG